MKGSIKVWHLGVMLLAFAFCTTLLVGCGGKITKENAGKITKGMSEKEIKDILGEPTDKSETSLGDVKLKVHTWKKDDNNGIVVTYDKDGKAELIVSKFN